MRKGLLILLLCLVAGVVLFLVLRKPSAPFETVPAPAPDTAAVSPDTLAPAETVAAPAPEPAPETVPEKPKAKKPRPVPRPAAAKAAPAETSDTALDDEAESFSFSDIQAEVKDAAGQAGDTAGPQRAATAYTGGVSSNLALAGPPLTPELMMKEIATKAEKKTVEKWQEKTIKDHKEKIEKDVQEYYQSFEFRLIGKWRTPRHGGVIRFHKDGTGHIVSPVVNKNAMALSGRYFFRYKLDKNVVTLIPVLTKGSNRKIVAHYIIELKGNSLKVGPVQYVKDYSE
jgi:hypothetical protein